MKMHRSDTDQVSIDDIVALLEDGPQETGKLAEWLGHPQARVVAACNGLVKAGTLQRLPHPDRRWALASFVAPASLLERISASQRVDAKPLRQPQERPPSQSVPTGAPSSWWLSAGPNGFTRTALDQLPRMHQSTFSRATAAAVPND